MGRFSSLFTGLLWNSEKNDAESPASIRPGAMELSGRSRSFPFLTRGVKNKGRGATEDGKRIKQRAKKKVKSRTECLNALKRALQEVVEAHAEITTELLQLPDSEFLSSHGQDKLSTTKRAVLSEATPAVGTLLFRIEQCLFHGLKSDAEFDGVHPFWALLGCIERSLDSHTVNYNEMKLRSSIQEVATVSNLSTALERAKAWIREAVRVEALEPFVFTLTKQNSLLQEFYDVNAVLRCSEASVILRSLCSSVTAFDFSSISVVPHSEEVEEMAEEGYSCSLITLASLSGGEFVGSRFQCSVCTPGSLVSPLLCLPTSTDDESENLQQSQKGSVNLEGQQYIDAHLPATGLQATPHQHKAAAKFNISDSKRPRNLPPKQKLFGTDIEAVLLDPKHTLWGSLEPSICIPDAIESLLDKLTHPDVAKTPGLLRTGVISSQVIEMVRFIEKKNSVPKKADGHILAAALLLYLYKLPQPILTYNLFDAFVSCGKVLHEGRATEEQITKRMRELLGQLPWAHRPVLVKLVDAAIKLLDVENTQASGLSPLRLSSVLGKALLRPYGNIELRNEEDLDPSLSNARNRVGLILIQNQEVVLDHLRVEQNVHFLNLQHKLERLKELQTLFLSKVYLKDDVHKALLVTIWASLGCAPTDLTVKCVHNKHNDPGSLPAPIDSSSSDASRWVMFGFCKSVETMNREFYACGSVLVLDCLAYFLEAYPQTATRLILSAKTSFQDITMLEKGKEVLEIVVHCLELFPPSAKKMAMKDTHTLYLEEGQKREMVSELGLRLSRGNNWSLCNDCWIVQEVFVACLLLLEGLHEEKSSNPQPYCFKDALEDVRKALVSTLSVPCYSASSMFKALRDNSGVNLFLDEEKKIVADYDKTVAVASTTVDVVKCAISATTYPKQGQVQDIPSDKDGSRAAAAATVVNVEAAETRGEEKGIEPYQDNSSLCKDITNTSLATTSSDYCAICQPQDLGMLENRMLAQWDPR